MESVFSMRFVLTLYNEGQLPLRESWDGSKKSRKLVWDGRQPDEYVSPGAEESPLLEAATKQRSEYRDWDTYLWMIVIYKV
jgi:hypothetical protein